MPTNSRLSKVSKERKKGRGRKFIPEIQEFTEACRIYAYDKQIYNHFDISRETFYSFLDRERYAEEQGKKSAFLAAYKEERNRTRKFALSNLLQLAKKGDTAASIFLSKTYGGLLETKDIKHIELKKIEVQLKQNAFLSELAKKFDLNKEELQKFADYYFKPIILE